MVRVVRRPDGSVVVDSAGMLEGRGAYLCADAACWELALKRSALQRALRTSLPNELTTQLEQGEVAAALAPTDHGAPSTMTGGTHGT
jgi:predicted RNA-binding protein YlxR (DUF448 family)